MTDRSWMVIRDNAKTRAGVEYALSLIYKDHGPMPEPNVELAEIGLSIIAGLFEGASGNALRGVLEEVVERSKSDAPLPIFRDN